MVIIDEADKIQNGDIVVLPANNGIPGINCIGKVSEVKRPNPTSILLKMEIIAQDTPINSKKPFMNPEIGKAVKVCIIRDC